MSPTPATGQLSYLRDRSGVCEVKWIDSMLSKGVEKNPSNLKAAKDTHSDRVRYYRLWLSRRRRGVVVIVLVERRRKSSRGRECRRSECFRRNGLGYGGQGKHSDRRGCEAQNPTRHHDDGDEGRRERPTHL